MRGLTLRASLREGTNLCTDERFQWVLSTCKQLWLVQLKSQGEAIDPAQCKKVWAESLERFGYQSFLYFSSGSGWGLVLYLENHDSHH